MRRGRCLFPMICANVFKTGRKASDRTGIVREVIHDIWPMPSFFRPAKLLSAPCPLALNALRCLFIASDAERCESVAAFNCRAAVCITPFEEYDLEAPRRIKDQHDGKDVGIVHTSWSNQVELLVPKLRTSFAFAMNSLSPVCNNALLASVEAAFEGTRSTALRPQRGNVQHMPRVELTMSAATEAGLRQPLLHMNSRGIADNEASSIIWCTHICLAEAFTA